MPEQPQLTEWDDDVFTRALREVQTKGNLKARRIRIEAERLAELINAGSRFSGDVDVALPEDAFPGLDVPLPDQEDLRSVLEPFEDAVAVERGGIRPRVQVRESLVEGDLRVIGKRLGTDLRLEGNFFRGHVHFTGATFEGESRFSQSIFAGAAVFSEATFQDEASFGSGTFRAFANFRGARFNGRAADFVNATFRDGADFNEATFGGFGLFADTTFWDDAWFYGATFKRDQRLGPTLVLGGLFLDDVTFEGRVELLVASDGVSCRSARFLERADLRVRWAEVALDDAEFARPSILRTLPPFDPSGDAVLAAISQGRAQRITQRVERKSLDRGRGESARVISLRAADVSTLTLSGVDLRACRFARARNLPGLRIEGASVFASTPERSGWTPRQALAEEHVWRASAPTAMPSRGPLGKIRHRIFERRRRGWLPPACTAPDWLDQLDDPNQLQPGELASLYRELRRGREENKDEPGAADFYYGEMEMRRLASKRLGGDGRYTPFAERMILWCYWLVSGYGLRVSRALVALAVTVVLFALGFSLMDSHQGAEPSFGESLLFSAESTTSLLRAPAADLTELGRVLQVPLRLLGPLFFGLALLSMRGRIKR